MLLHKVYSDPRVFLLISCMFQTNRDTYKLTEKVWNLTCHKTRSVKINQLYKFGTKLTNKKLKFRRTNSNHSSFFLTREQVLAFEVLSIWKLVQGILFLTVMFIFCEFFVSFSWKITVSLYFTCKIFVFQVVSQILKRNSIPEFWNS